LLKKVELEKSLGFKFGRKNLLVTFHPVTLEIETVSEQMDELLGALEKLENVHIVFTMPNADTGGRILFKMIEDFVSKNPSSKAFTSLGQTRYLSCLNHVDGVIGNSSSGLSEAPTFKIGTINIGDRQRGRMKARSVIDCEPNEPAISSAIKKLYSSDFQNKLTTVKNPYGYGGASESIVNILNEVSLDGLLKKKFCNLN